MQQQKLQKQMAADARVLDDKSDLPQTGPRSGSQKSRAVESESLRLPPEFVLDVKKAEEESGAHLEAIKKHFTDSLGMLDLSFNPGEQWNITAISLFYTAHPVFLMTSPLTIETSCFPLQALNLTIGKLYRQR